MAENHNSTAFDRIDFNRGFDELTLCEQIQTILHQYPDNGQILKEIIQNADDAGATQVKFLLDVNNYPSNSLIRSELNKYQGPALLSFNDALFQSRDWNQGIKRMYKSNKKDDPLKVGRFGLGFKSVFHITDLPSFISGHGIAFMDPHKDIFKVSEQQRSREYTSAYVFHLTDNRDEILAATDQWLPYKHSVLGNCVGEGFETGLYYNGTLFRFPLRNDPTSQLSPSIYTQERVQALFETIKHEAYLYLLFLRNIELIQLYSNVNGTMQLEFEVFLTSQCKTSILIEKAKLTENTREGRGYSGVYDAGIEMKHYKNGIVDRTERVNFKVCQHCADQSFSELHELADKLGVRPLVGVASPLDSGSATIGSQVFCFMPLTIEQENGTGLPVHVNGYFSVDNNRKHIKMQNLNDDSQDLGIQWNRHLVDSLLPEAMVQLVLNAIGQNRFSSAQIYSMFPDLSSVNSYWLSFVRKFYESMKYHCIIQIQSQNEIVWTLYEQTMIKQATWSHSFLKLAERIFKFDAKPFAEIPPHIQHAFTTCCQLNPQEATMMAVSESFRRVHDKIKFNPDELCILLETILQSGQYSLLIGLPLLPLADGNWISFMQSDSPTVVYLENGGNTKSLLLGNIDGRFVNSLIASEQNFEHFKKLAISKVTQLELFAPHHFQKEISQICASRPVYPSEHQVQNLWDFLYKEFSLNLDAFSGLYILPVSDTIEKLPFSNEVVIENHPCLITPKEKQLLSLLGVLVIAPISENARRHPQIRNFVLDSSLQGKFTAIFKTYTHSIDFKRNVSNLPSDLNVEFRKLLSAAPDSEVSKIAGLMTSLPVFETLYNSDTNFVCGENMKAGPTSDYILPLPIAIINKDADYSEHLLRMIGTVSFLTTTDVMIEILRDPAISHHPLHLIELFVEKCISVDRNDATLWQLLSGVSFVRKKSEERAVKAEAVLDPRDARLKILFEGEDVFPEGKFSDERFLEDLKRLGMRNSTNLNDEEVIMIARSIDNDSSRWIGKSEALLNYFHDYPDVWRRVCDSISSYHWLPVLHRRPSNYPENLHWAGEEFFTGQLSTIRAHSRPTLCGSVCKVCAIPSEIFGSEPSVKEVCCHLRHCAESYRPCLKGSYLQMLHSIYRYLQNKCCHGEVLETLKEENMEKWLLVGDEFVSPSQCCFEKSFSDFSPYIYTIPAELLQYEELLRECGVVEKCSYIKILNAMKEKYDKTPEASVYEERDLNYAVLITNHLSNNPSENVGDVVLPVAGKRCMFLPTNECAYCDVGIHERGINIDDLEEENIHLIHPSISNQTAEDLGVQTLLSVLLSDEDLGFDSGCGQEESLTTRLRNLLRDYRDGLAVIKELIQNADDAGASVVKIVYDERHHTDHQSSLFDEKMKSLQGPALLAYNDAVFSEDDFKNIVKLGGGTKEKMAEKVGRFGLGFNSVYNLTEVPSFISANNIVFFDPHRKYLGKALKDKQPGIKLDLRKRMARRQLSVLRDQFHPLNGLFGCDVSSQSSMTYYEGTLFRFPLRNHEQADCSEICDIVYSSSEMKALLELLFQNRHEVLLFTQNIKKIEVFHLNHGTELLPKFCVDKRIGRSFDSLSVQNRVSAGNNNILVSTKTMLSENSPQINRSTFVHESFCEINKEEEESSKLFLISLCSGRGRSFDFALRRSEFLPIGGVAFPIDSDLHPVIKETSLLYCFLPLPIETHLTFHINGYFAVSSNRSELYTANNQDKRSENSEWNEVVMSDPVVESCLRCLQVMKENWNSLNEEEWYSLWPTGNVDLESIPVRNFVQSFYNRIVERSDLSLFVCEGRWSNFHNCVFLESEFERSRIGRIGRNILHQVLAILDPNKIVVSICKRVVKKMIDHGHCSITDHEYNRERFFSEVVFPNVETIEPDNYRELMILTLCDLQESDSFLIEELKDRRCIPCSGSVRKFLKAKELIDPSSPLNVLFSEEDGRFPLWKEADVGNILFSECSRTSQKKVYATILEKLRHLGMACRYLSWSELIERSSTIVDLQDNGLALKRSNCIVKVMKENLQEKSTPTAEERRDISSIAFLPIMKNDSASQLVWNDGREDLWCSPEDGFLNESKHLVSCSSPVIDMWKRFDCGNSQMSVLKCLNLYQKSVSMEKVEKQLSSVVDLIQSNERVDRNQVSTMRVIIFEIFSYFESLLTNRNSSIETSVDLKNLTMIYCSEIRQFVAPMRCVQTGPAFPPYIYSLDRVFRERFPHLVIYLEIEESASAERYVDALRKIYEESDGQKLTDETLKTAVGIILELCECINEDNIDPGDLPPIHAPDSDNKMQPACDLCYNNFQWLEDDQFQFIHSHIPYIKAKLLGVKENRSQLLSRHQLGIPFGQKEKLTRRINTILSGYPFDVSILKELLQNADDAGAGELHFILDCRKYESKRVFSEGWRHLQGAALLVYNDKPFSESDLAAIQNLGEGNKRDDPIQTGQYGVGFNCVYHLTDCPTFLTTVPGEGECLCAFDPHCRYVPDATNDRPGQRFTNIDYLEKKFPDVFECYRVVQTAIGNTGGTLFRLPLRTKEMAESSVLVDDKKEVTVERVKQLFDEMSGCLSHYLLFLKCVKSIKLSEIDRSGCLKLIVCSDACVDSSSVDALNNFNNHVRSQTRLLKESKCLQNAALSDVSYTMTIKTRNSQSKKNRFGTKNNEGNWLIIKRFGFCDVPEFPEDLLESYQEGSLGLIPLGGLAVPLMENKFEGNFNLFCLLPLPIDSHLPVHINGHFALDYESRRSLSHKVIGKKWNLFLTRYVIAPLYLTALESIKSYSNLHDTCEKLKQFETWYFQKFPTYYFEMDKDEQLSCHLSRKVFQYLADCDRNLYPMITKCGPDSASLSWHPLRSHGNVTTVFNTLNVKPSYRSVPLNMTSFTRTSRVYREKMTLAREIPDRKIIFSDLLRSFGMVLIDCPSNVVNCFHHFHIPIAVTSPEIIAGHFSRNASCQSIIGKRLDQTVFESFDVFQMVFDFVFDYSSDVNDENIDHFKSIIENAPLMLSADGIIRVLSRRECSLFSFEFRHLIPRRKDLFAHPELMKTHLNSKILNTFIRQFTIADLSNYLSEMLPLTEFSNGPFQMEKLYKYVKESWFICLWSFLFNCISNLNSKEEKQTLLCSNLSEWCIVPVLQKGTAKLVPVKHLKCVINLTNAPELQREALADLNVFVPNYFTEKFIKLNELVGEFCNLDDIFNSLSLVSDTFSRCDLSISEAEELCTLLSSWLKTSGNYSCWLNLLKQVPIYVNASGSVTCVSHCERIHTLPDDVPLVGIDKWSHSDGSSIVYLQANQLWNPLYQHIGCTTINIGDVYVDVILPSFPRMPSELQLEHLKFLRNLFQNKFKWNVVQRKEEIVSTLKRLPFIYDNGGVLRMPNYFYHPEVNIFKLMVEDRILPKEPFSADWLDFMIELGLIQQVSEEDFLKFANIIANSPSIELKNQERSKELVKVLFYNQSENYYLLNQIKSIPFLCPKRIHESLEKFAPQYGNPCDLICFYNSCLFHHENLIWTQYNLLPEYYNPQAFLSHKCAESICYALGVKLVIPVEKICQHLLILCRRIPKTNSELFLAILVRIFRHLKNVDVSSVRDLMREKGIIPLENVSHLVQPIHLVTRNLTDKQEIKPFLCALPIFLGEFEELFIRLGAQKTLHTGCYAEVLYQLYKISGGGTLCPNESLPVIKATKGLFDQLEENTSTFVFDRDILYLPSSKRALHSSNAMVYVDDPSLKDRIPNLEEPMLYSVHLNFDFKELFQKLPESMRPIPLSSILREEIESVDLTEDTGDIFNDITRRIKDDEFIRGIVRLCLHHYNGSKPEQFKYIKECLYALKFVAFSRLITHLIDRCKPMESSQQEQFIYLARECDEWKIYMHANPVETLKQRITLHLVEYLLKILDLRPSLALQLSYILQISGHEIDAELDRLRVKVYHADNTDDDFILPCGVYVPLELHSLLIQGVDENIDIGTYVAYQTYDPEDEDHSVYKVAKILKFMKDNTNRLLSSCEIDLGDGSNTTVSILFIHRFERNGGSIAIDDDVDGGSTDCVLANSSPPDYDINEVMQQIRKTLAEAQTLSPDLYKQLIKRLILIWHPDKNPNDVERCTKLFQFLQNEIKRQKAGLYDDLFDRMGRRASNYNKSRFSYAHFNYGWSGNRNYRRYRGHWFNFNDNCSGPSFDFRQPAEAKRWMRQAEWNFQSANESCSTCHEWKCFQYRQAAELALKAIMLAQTGDLNDSTDLLQLCSGNEKLRSLCQELQTIGSFKSFLYPDKNGRTIPHDIYNELHSTRARDNVREILSLAKSQVDSNH